MLEARVHTTVRSQADQVNAAAGPGRSTFESGSQHRVRSQRAVLDRQVDPRQVLHDDGAGAEVEMPHLRVAHLTLRQADGETTGGQRSVRVAVPELVKDRRAGL